jgi:branched-chain amino acid transport system substrate-binding protein
MNTIIKANPDVLVQSWAGSGNRELFSAMRDTGIFTRMRVTGGLGDREARHALGQDAVGMIGAIKYSYLLPDNPINDWLKENHLDEYGEYPDLFTCGGFAAGVAIVEGLKKAGGSSDPEILIPVMEGMSIDTPKGRYTFREEDHQAIQPMYVVEMVSDPEQKQPWCIPKLIHETTPEQTAPPISVKASSP